MALISESWLSLAIVAVVVGGLVWVVVHSFNRKQIANLRKRLELRDDQLADAKAEIKRLEEIWSSLEGERQPRQNLEALLASLREQLAIAQQQLMAAPRHAVPPSRESPRQAKFDELFGHGSAIVGKLTKGEAEQIDRGASRANRPHEIESRAGPDAWSNTVAFEARGLKWTVMVALCLAKGAFHTPSNLSQPIERTLSTSPIRSRQPSRSNQILEFRLRKIVGNVGLIAGLLNVAGGFIRSMERLNDGATYPPAFLEMALRGPFQIMVQAQTAVGTWMRLFIERRSPAVHQEASTLL